MLVVIRDTKAHVKLLLEMSASKPGCWKSQLDKLSYALQCANLGNSEQRKAKKGNLFIVVTVGSGPAWVQ